MNPSYVLPFTYTLTHLNQKKKFIHSSQTGKNHPKNHPKKKTNQHQLPQRKKELSNKNSQRKKQKRLVRKLLVMMKTKTPTMMTMNPIRMLC
jgi:hypothetical protein